MIAETPGNTSNAFFRPLGSSPATAPISGELATNPNHPAVAAMPVAVAAIAGNRAFTTARAVGNTGAIATPARNTSTQAVVGLAL